MVIKKIKNAIKLASNGELGSELKRRRQKKADAKVFSVLKEDKKKAWEYNYKKKDASFKYYADYISPPLRTGFYGTMDKMSDLKTFLTLFVLNICVTETISLFLWIPLLKRW